MIKGFITGLCLFIAGLLALPSNAQFNGCATGFCSPLVTGSALLLDTLSATPIFAIDTHKLRGAYGGSPIKVTTSAAGNATQDIGFDASNNTDASALASFVGANTGSVDTAYNQAASGATSATNATVADQPLVRLTGTNQTLNGSVSMNFNKAIRPSQLSYTPMVHTQPITIAVCFSNSALAINHLHDNGSAARVLLGFDGIVGAYQMYAGGTPLTIGTVTNATHTVIGIFDQAGAGSALYVDGSALATGNTTIGTGSFDGATAATLGNKGMTGYVSTILGFASVVGATDRGTFRTYCQTQWGAL